MTFRAEPARVAPGWGDYMRRRPSAECEPTGSALRALFCRDVMGIHRIVRQAHPEATDWRAVVALLSCSTLRCSYEPWYAVLYAAK